MRKENNFKEHLENCNYKIHALKRDNKREFKIKDHPMLGYDLFEVIDQKEYWVFSGKKLDNIHTHLCVIYNFLQTEKIAESIKTKEVLTID